MRSTVFFSAFFLLVPKKTVCVKRQFTVENTAFYQRIEILNALDCVERCIEAADSCRAVVYVEHSKKSFCQFYNVNSEERPADVKPVRTLEPTTTLFELLDVCAVEAAVHSRDFLSQLTPALKRILDGLPSGKRKNSKAQRELSFVVDDPHSAAADRSLIFGAHAERDEAVPNRETYVVRPEYPFDGQKSAGRKGTVGKAIQSDTDYTDLNANGGDGGAPVPRRLATSITPVRGGGGGGGGTSGGGRNEVYSVGNPQPISPVLVSHGGVPQPRGGATNGGGGYAVSPSGYAATYNSIGRGTAGRLGQPFDCRTVPCEQPRAPISPAPCPPIRLPTDPCIPQSAGVERASAYWSEWAPTGVCSVTCGAGVRQRRRTCSSGNNADCSGEATKEEPCILPECNMWTAWSAWTGCSASCGGGTKSRTRACRNGRECVGPAEDVRDCGEEPCPYFSQWTKPCPTWGPWERWSDCSKSCGMGERVRKRECLNGLGDDCVGTNEDHMFCNQQTCPT
ncbi:Apple domain-containing protein [Aphelenchoides fujianensis]|nr:Apple domain-containing protein [Aphelenchoides fujianensis]